MKQRKPMGIGEIASVVFKTYPKRTFVLPFAVGNFMGPLLLGRFFDTVGPSPHRPASGSPPYRDTH